MLDHAAEEKTRRHGRQGTSVNWLVEQHSGSGLQCWTIQYKFSTAVLTFCQGGSDPPRHRKGEKKKRFHVQLVGSRSLTLKKLERYLVNEPVVALRSLILAGVVPCRTAISPTMVHVEALVFRHDTIC